MKNVFGRFLFVVAMFAIFAGCSAASRPSGPVKVKLPWPHSDGSYRLKVVEIQSVRNLTEMRGDVAMLHLAPEINPATGGFFGRLPVARFEELSDGVLLPSNTTSAELATIYAHTEKIIEMSRGFGLADGLPLPRRIVLDAQLLDADNSRRRILNNAIFYGAWDALMIVPYRQTNLPLSMNAGVLAHEHFHGIFFHSVLKEASKDFMSLHGPVRDVWGERRERDALLDVFIDPKDEKSDILKHNAVLLRAFNEGLADFWGWAYSQDPDFIRASLPSVSKARKLSSDFAMIDSQKIVDDISTTTDNSHLAEKAYEIGHEYANFLKALSESEGMLTTAQQMKSVFGSIREQIKKTLKSEKWRPTLLAELYFKAGPVDDKKRAVPYEKFMGEDVFKKVRAEAAK